VFYAPSACTEITSNAINTYTAGWLHG